MEEKFPRTGWKLNKNKKQKRYVLSEDKFDHIGAGMEASHRRSLRLLAVRGGVSKPSVRKAPELLKLGPDSRRLAPHRSQTQLKSKERTTTISKSPQGLWPTEVGSKVSKGIASNKQH
jgi:hypothetical protein